MLRHYGTLLQFDPYCTEWATKKEPAFRFARVLATALISVFTGATLSWPNLSVGHEKVAPVRSLA